jgi:hypothetical protein
MLVGEKPKSLAKCFTLLTLEQAHQVILHEQAFGSFSSPASFVASQSAGLTYLYILKLFRIIYINVYIQTFDIVPFEVLTAVTMKITIF